MKSKFECKVETTDDSGSQQATLVSVSDESSEFELNEITVTAPKGGFVAGNYYTVSIDPAQ